MACSKGYSCPSPPRLDAALGTNPYSNRMSDRTEQLLTEIVELHRRQLANQERALAGQEEAVALQRDAIARQRSALQRVWRLVILVLALIAITYGISIIQWYGRR